MNCNRFLLACFTNCWAIAAAADLSEPELNGHLKYQFQAAHYPAHSLYRDLYGATSSEHLLDGRLKLSAREKGLDYQVDYQVLALEGERFTNPTGLDVSGSYPEDERRVLDLTKVLSDDEDTAIIHRLDRFHLGFVSDKGVVRIGRQVLSWGNGLIFNPVDFFNPFDPAALDTEYKTGDDMLYGQYLLEGGDDLQAVLVGRRNERGSLSADHSSAVLKYHAWADSWFDNEALSGAELDLLVGQHYDDSIAALGLVQSVGGAVWRGDLMLTRTDTDTLLSAVANLSYSWTWGGRNVSGIAEYYYNGFGLDGDYSLQALQSETQLLERLGRGELYTLGRHYLGLAATIELNALWLATPTLLMNLEDQSALLQLGSRYDLAQNWNLIAALNLPLGPKGSEYGGLRLNAGSGSIAVSAGLFAQLAFYF